MSEHEQRHLKRSTNINTILLSLLMAVGGFLGEETYREVRATHDAVLKYDVQITDLRARVAAVEVEIQKMKEHKP